MSATVWAYQPKLPLHELSLRKSLIKNHTTLFHVGSSHQSNQPQLGFTKSNNFVQSLYGLCVRESVKTQVLIEDQVDFARSFMRSLPAK